MHEQHAFTWLSLIPGLHGYANHVVMAVVIALLLAVATAVARFQLGRALSAPGGALVPEGRLSFLNFFEIIAESLYKLTESVIGHHDAPIHFPLIGTLFVFIFTSNVCGLIPGFLPPTDNLNTTLALGAFVFIYYNISGFRAHGAGYLKHFLGPVLWLAPLMIIIEVASHVFRPLSLALRLRGNIMGDHVVLSTFSGLSMQIFHAASDVHPVFGVLSSLVPALLPVIFYGLGVFVAFIQAFVFCLMTMVYISLSTSHDH